MQPSVQSRVVFFDDLPERREDLGYIRHQLDALAYARAVSGLTPRDALEYQRLCDRELAILEAMQHWA
jgi:hypothetical protein